MKMKHVDQTNPDTNAAFGLSFYGPAPVTDGGYDSEIDTEKMEDVSHEPPEAGAVRSFERGPQEYETDEAEADEAETDEAKADGSEEEQQVTDADGTETVEQETDE